MVLSLSSPVVFLTTEYKDFIIRLVLLIYSMYPNYKNIIYTWSILRPLPVELSYNKEQILRSLQLNEQFEISDQSLKRKDSADESSISLEKQKLLSQKTPKVQGFLDTIVYALAIWGSIQFGYIFLNTLITGGTTIALMLINKETMTTSQRNIISSLFWFSIGTFSIMQLIPLLGSAIAILILYSKLEAIVDPFVLIQNILTPIVEYGIPNVSLLTSYYSTYVLDLFF
ncbi:UNKNOWN [Stylonychia lemnae]|uniref:Uncharacterized protein n=1 Tax=Stylonychia lemnae TaxID=5949 RepID=A0A077ZVM9_STYLE|nr:UNKNOWN [Stylonychia lemnae]|eukprot:CDW73990.1 UNKNOWN [Stylonychia lemnae]